MSVFDRFELDSTEEKKTPEIALGTSSVQRSSVFDKFELEPSVTQTEEEFVASDIGSTKSYENVKRDAEIRATAVRFAKDHLGYEDISEDDAISEFI